MYSIWPCLLCLYSCADGRTASSVPSPRPNLLSHSNDGEVRVLAHPLAQEKANVCFHSVPDAKYWGGKRKIRRVIRAFFLGKRVEYRQVPITSRQQLVELFGEEVIHGVSQQLCTAPLRKQKPLRYVPSDSRFHIACQTIAMGKYVPVLGYMSWNVSSLRKAARLHQICNQMSLASIHIAGLQGTRIPEYRQELDVSLGSTCFHVVHWGFGSPKGQEKSRAGDLENVADLA